MAGELTHLSEDGSVRMVDVSEKAVTARVAKAAGKILMDPNTVEEIATGNLPKGNVLETARIAGIMAAKRTSDLIPLCHPIAVTGVELTFEAVPDGIVARCVVKVDERTGVEMEALAAVSTSLLTIYDMCKAIDKSMVIGDIRLIKKTGGRSGTYVRPGEEV
jgi:cyclic pyranopterin phosphate synthase